MSRLEETDTVHGDASRCGESCIEGYLALRTSNVLALHEADADGMSGFSPNTQASVACLADAKMVKSDGTLVIRTSDKPQ